ncbi:MAG TPA: protein kinase, partial [Anaerolineales bacterium]|nr:protein kinase [Anaerolineales bacterium]
VIAKLRHPNIVQVYDFDAVDSNPYLVMEFIEGPSLSNYLNHLHQNHGRLPLPQVIRMLRAVASALQYAHNNGIVHRDVKPGNILLTSPSRHIEVGKPLPEDFEPVLTDFGLVRFQDGHRQTTTGHIAGTPAYMSPEQSRGEAVDGRADVYSLGIVLYEMLAGDVPFDGESTVSILLKQVTEPPQPIPGLSLPIQNVLDRALAKNVKNRFQTPMELADAFSAVVGMKDHDAPTVQFNELPTILPSEAVPALTMEPPAQAEEPAKPQKRWPYIALPALAAIAIGGFIWINNLPSSVPGDGTATLPSSATYTITHTLLPPTATSTQTAVLPSGPVGILHFQNGSALADQASLTTQGMPAPPPGSHYEIWLTGANERISLGIFLPDKNGKAALTFSDPDGANLIARYGGLEVTIESDPDPDPEPSGLTVYTFTLPQAGLPHVRFLLSAFAKTPDKGALAQGLYANVKQIAELAQEMQSASDSGDQKTVRQKAETALNILVGSKSADYKDWNGDGKTDPSKSYGLLLNGSEYGYIQAVQLEADYLITNTPGTPEYAYLIANGRVVKTCAQNMAQWAPDLRTLLLAILNTTSEASTSQSIRDLVTLTDQMLNGIDLDKSGKVDAVSGECGAATAYESAYRMADMLILPAGLSDQLTEQGNLFTPASTSAAQNGSGGTSVVTTPKSTNTKKPIPTQKPKPTQKPPGGGGGGGGGGNPHTPKPPKK